MANEITLNASLAYEDAEGSDVTLSVAELLASVGTLKFVHAKQNIGIAEEAIGLGEVTSLGWAIFINRDSTNFIELRVGTGSTKFAKIAAGKFCLLFLGSGITAPYAISDNAACQMEYLIISQ